MNLMLLILIMACSSPTKYQRNKKGEGYQDSRNGQLRLTEFTANSHTKIEDTLTMAEYRAVELCSPQLSYFLASENLSRVREVTRTTGTHPFYNTGYYPYGRGWSVGIGLGSYSSESWQDKQVFPLMRVSYLCGQQFFAPQGNFKSVTAAELAHIHKDLLGAIVVEDIVDKEVLEKGDVILKINGKRVESLTEFYWRFQQHPLSTLEILREGERKILTIKANDITAEVQKFSEHVLKKMCKLDAKFCTKED